DAPTTTNCNTGDTSYGWWTPLHKGRSLAEDVYEAITGWEGIENEDQLLAQSALYAAIPYDVFGEYFCEMAFDEGTLMTPDETLAQGEEWLTIALDHIATTGDFEIEPDIASSAEQFAYVLRARVRWARGNNAGALEDAARVQAGFVAWATRDGGGQRFRWNRVFASHNSFGMNTVIGPIDWWTGPGWPDVIPYTGYRNLGILPDGRAVTDDRYPITTTESETAVADTRVRVRDEGAVTNTFPRWSQQKYPGLDANIPLANWEEVWLIRAELEGGQAAIDFVNEIRSAHDLPLVTYLSATDAEGVTELIIEERRRSLFMEGRYWATKIREDLWFPRGVGSTPYPYSYRNGIRMVMPESEFEINPNLELSQRGTMCGDEAPA
ncbi:MAG: RagB/SusD family nutrient uptake outer membrane protein, partial [Gemmatimonas sp.]|nr:RagB/SusD family nutrient uptake outer membrane protein [Gemmatimonas sp.]